MRRLVRSGAAVFASLLFLVSIPWLWRLSTVAVVPAHGFNLVEWEFRHFGNKWLYELGRALKHDGLTPAEKDARLSRYFALNDEIRTLERQLAQNQRERGSPEAADSDVRHRLRAMMVERRRLRSDVEAVLEERLTAVLESQGLALSAPFLPRRWHVLWPPVDAALTQPPRLLVSSPRDRIFVQETRLLRSGLSLEEIIGLEERAESEGENVSAIVVTIGGFASYPAAVPEGLDYGSTLEAIAHEWTHHYLSFRPLGRRYFGSRDMTTINETVASISGRELAGLVQRAFPLETASIAKDGFTSESGNRIDADQVLRELRLEVENLLREGKVAEAEGLMEERRRYLADHGVYIRKINQAYFAFHGLYGDSPLSISPLGPKVQAVRDRSASIGEFLRRMADVTSVADLERLAEG